MSKPKPDYKISLYGIPGFLHAEAMTVWGTNAFTDWLLKYAGDFHDFWVLICVSIFPGWEPPPGFPFKVLEEL